MSITIPPPSSTEGSFALVYFIFYCLIIILPRGINGEGAEEDWRMVGSRQPVGWNGPEFDPGVLA